MRHARVSHLAGVGEGHRKGVRRRRTGDGAKDRERSRERVMEYSMRANVSSSPAAEAVESPGRGRWTQTPEASSTTCVWITRAHSWHTLLVNASRLEKSHDGGRVGAKPRGGAHAAARAVCDGVGDARRRGGELVGALGVGARGGGCADAPSVSEGELASRRLQGVLRGGDAGERRRDRRRRDGASRGGGDHARV